MTHPNRVRLSKLSLGLMVALAAAPVFAQSTSAGVGGQVVGADGQPVAGAEVTITHVESGTVSRATTDAAGRYTARGLRVGGPYTITINKAGAGSDSEENVYLTLNQVNTVDAQLNNDVATLGTVQAVASAGTSVFSATKMGSGTSVDQETLRALPSINGNIQDFMRLDPRVAFTDRASGSISAGGLNPRFNKITIDGVSASDTFGLEGNNMPTQRQPVAIAAIEALDISLSNYDVTIAGAAGANINAVTKSGTNEFHGSVYGNFRDGEWFGKHPLTRTEFTEFTDEKTYGFTLGGPIMKDKLFFFANYEKFERSKPGFDIGGSPFGTGNTDFTAADVTSVQQIAQTKWGIDAGGLEGVGDTELEEYGLKLDWNVNEDHRASFRYNKLDQSRVRPEGSGVSGGDFTLALSSNWFQHTKVVESYVAQVFSDWTENFSTEFKASFRDYDAYRITPTTAPQITIFFDDDRNAANGFQVSGDAIRLGTEFSSMNNVLLTKTWNYFGAATWTLGDHDVKFGFEYADNDIYNFFAQNYYGSYTFYGMPDDPTTPGVIDPLTSIQAFNKGIYATYSATLASSPGSIPAEYKSRNLGLFVQDTWYVNSNLTLTYGLRADKPSTSPDTDLNTCFASARVVANNGPANCVGGGFGLDNRRTYGGGFVIQPRAGFNYTFDSDRQMQLRGGVGLFQGDSPQVWVSNIYTNNGLNTIPYSGGTFTTVNTPATGTVSGVGAPPAPFSPDGLNQPAVGGCIPYTATGRNCAPSLGIIADDFKLPSVWKANLAFETETGLWDTVFSAELLLTKVKDGLFYRSLNVGPGFTGPDGRTLYWNPDFRGAYPFQSNTLTNAYHNVARFGRNPYFNDVYQLENTSKGKSEQFTVSLSKPYSAESDWSWTLGYTYTNATEVGALTSSTIGSGFGSQLSFNINEEAASTARYEIKDRFSGSLDWKHKFFGDYQTRVGLVYEGRSGRPYSYVFNGDANGDNRTFNDLFYVPKGPGDVIFASTINSTTGNAVNDPVREKAFFDWLATQERLGFYKGTYAPENAFRAGWVNTFDLRISQELPGFFRGHKSQLWVDIQNVGNLLNKDWGHILDWGFNGSQGAASLVGIDKATGKYVYNYVTGTTYGQPGNFNVPSDSDRFTNGISQWSVQVGLKYEF